MRGLWRRKWRELFIMVCIYATGLLLLYAAVQFVESLDDWLDQAPVREIAYRDREVEACLILKKYSRDDCIRLAGGS